MCAKREAPGSAGTQAEKAKGVWYSCKSKACAAAGKNLRLYAGERQNAGSSLAKKEPPFALWQKAVPDLI